MDRNIVAAMTLLTGALTGFFLVFRTLLSDGPHHPLHPEYLAAYGIAVAGYAVLAFGIGRWGQLGSRSGVLLALPGVIIVVAYNDAALAIRALLLVAMTLGTLAGLLGAWHRRPAAPTPA